MSTKTRADLIQEVLDWLLVTEAGQPIQDVDSAVIDSMIDPICDALSIENVYYFGDTDTFDGAPFVYLLRIIAENCASKYGRPGNGQIVDNAKDDLRLLSRINRGSGRLLRTEGVLRRGMRTLGSRVLS